MSLFLHCVSLERCGVRKGHTSLVGNVGQLFVVGFYSGNTCATSHVWLLTHLFGPKTYKYVDWESYFFLKLLLTPPWIIKYTFTFPVVNHKSQVNTCFPISDACQHFIIGTCGLIAVTFHVKPLPFLFFTTPPNMCHHFIPVAYWPENEFELYFTVDFFWSFKGAMKTLWYSKFPLGFVG